LIRVFVGCAPNHEDAESQAVLEYTIRKHASQPVEITWMRLTNDRRSPFFVHRWDTSTWATPFSGFRYAVPALCGYEGCAIYMDSDVIVQADVAELAALPARGFGVVARASNRLCVSLWNCGALPTALPLDAIRVGGRAPLTVRPFPSDQQWNVLDGERYELDDPRVKAIHYTSMPHQPHLGRAMRRLKCAGRSHWFDGKPTRHWRADLLELFDRLFHEAHEAGYTVDRYCQHEPDVVYSKGSNANLRGEVPSWAR